MAAWHTDRFGGLQRPRGEGVPTAAALGAEVRRGRRRVVDVRQDVVVPPLLLRAVRVVTVRGRGPGEMTICEGERTKSSVSVFYISFNFLLVPSESAVEGCFYAHTHGDAKHNIIFLTKPIYLT